MSSSRYESPNTLNAVLCFSAHSSLERKTLNPPSHPLRNPSSKQLELEERTSVARVRAPRKQNEGGGEANGGGRTRNRGRRGGGGGGGGGEGGEYGGGENGEEGGEGRGRRVPPVAENSVYIKGFPDTTTEDDIRAEVRGFLSFVLIFFRLFV